MNVAVIVAGGQGDRLGAHGGKQLLLVDGRPVLAHTLVAFDACRAIDAIVVVAHPERVDEYRARAVEPLGSSKVIAVVAGGPTRTASVRAGLAAVPVEADVIVVHDGARPLVTPQLIEDAIGALDAAEGTDAIVVGHPSYDTLKIVADSGQVTGTADRSVLWAAQTPQVFRAAALRACYAAPDDTLQGATDDAALVERAGGVVRVFGGPRDNIKVTVPEDVTMVEALLASRRKGRADG